MKSKSGRHKDENTFKFRTFSERISAINVDVIHRVRHVNEKTSEEISYFYQDFEKWDVLNITEGYCAFKKEIKINLLVTLPQVIAHKEHIVETLLKYLKFKDPLYLQPLLSLTASLASDLRDNFYEHYHDFYDTLLELLETKDTEQLEWVFQCLAYFFHKLWKCLVKDFKKIFLSLLPLLSENKAEYINNFAAESFTFVTRKVKDRKYLLDLILKIVSRKNDGIRGCGRLFFEVVKGVNGQLHSCSEEFLPLLFESLSEHDNLLTEILEYTIAYITDYISPSKSEIFWTSLLTALNKSFEIWKEQKDEKYLNSAESLLKLLGQAIEHKNGKIVYNLGNIINEVVRGLNTENIPENIVLTLIKVVIVILLSNNIRLSQEDAALLVKNSLAVKYKAAKLYFVDNITEFSCFEPLILPNFLKSCEENRFEKDHLRVLTNVILKKAPLTNDGINIKNWSKYPLNMRSNETNEKIENLLLEVIEGEISDKERTFCTLVCIPHMNLKKTELLKQSLSKRVLNLLKKCDRDQKETFFFLNLHMECLLHLNSVDFFSEHFQEILDVILPLLDQNSVLPILKITSLLVAVVEGRELINIETLKLLNGYFGSFLSSPFHEVRLLTTFIYTLFEDIPEFDLVHSTDPDAVKEKFEVFTLCYSIESVDPQISTYHNQTRNLEKLSFEKPQMTMCHQTDFKDVPLRYICGVLYMNFQLLWQHTLNIIETHAHGLNIALFWNVYGEQMKLADEYVQNNLVLPVDTMENEYCTLTEFYENWQKSDSKPDFANYRLLLWKGLSSFPDVGEAKTKDISALLLRFYENEFTKYNAELAYTWNIKQKDLEVEDVLDPEEDAENEEPTAKSVPNKVGKMNGKKKLKETIVSGLRLLGIGRNEYIDLINQSRSNRSRLFGKTNVRTLLPRVPCNIHIEPWWRVEIGLVLEEDIKMVNEEELTVIDRLIDQGSQSAGELDFNIVTSLYKKGLIYLDVPITAVDSVQVPPLQGFVMNRVTGDYFETLLYKIFVSIDEHITIGELANSVLQVDTELVKQAVSLYCRLQFARKLNPETDVEASKRHPSWSGIPQDSDSSQATITPLTLNFNSKCSSFSLSEELLSPDRELPASPATNTLDRKGQRIAFLFDSALTAFLMMGNLSQGLKKHAVTMFEVGKLCDESLDSFLAELEKVSALDAEGEGEARRFFDHAVILRSTILALRKLPSCGLDLVRLESLQTLDEATCSRLLQKKYKLLVSMAPLSREVRPVFSLSPPHLGPAVPEVNSLWFKLFIYHITGYGPPSLLLVKGSSIKQLPRMFLGYSKLLVTTWLHEPAIIPISNVIHVNAALKYAPVLIQAYGVHQVATTKVIPFPFRPDTPIKGSCELNSDYQYRKHPASRILNEVIDIERNCGFLTFVNIGVLDFGCPNREPTVRLVNNARKNIAGHSKIERVKTEASSNIAEPTSISNENFSLTLKKPPSKSNESSSSKEQDKLEGSKAPTEGETHCNITPTEKIQSSSPKNGFISEENSKLLEEELGKLDNEDNVLNKVLELSLSTTFSMEGLVTPSEEHVSMFSRESNSKEDVVEEEEKEDEHKGEVWTLLDCHFGVPLFDANANTKICDTIVFGGLGESTSLTKLVESGRKLGSMLLDFISQCQYYPGENMEIMKRGRLVPQPRYNLVFDNGKVSEWSGK